MNTSKFNVDGLKYPLLDVLRYYYRTKTLVRFNTRMRIKDESVAEHSYFVALISMMLYTKLMTYSSFRDSVKQKFGDQWLVPLAYIMVKSILHDLPEAALSDIPHDAKRILKSVVPGFARALDDLEESFFQRALIRDMLSNVDSVLSKVVKLSDIISVYVYTDNEGKLGNHTLSDISDDARTRIISLRDDFPEGFIDSLFTSTDWSL